MLKLTLLTKFYSKFWVTHFILSSKTYSFYLLKRERFTKNRFWVSQNLLILIWVTQKSTHFHLRYSKSTQFYSKLLIFIIYLSNKMHSFFEIEEENFTQKDNQIILKCKLWVGKTTHLVRIWVETTTHILSYFSYSKLCNIWVK